MSELVEIDYDEIAKETELAFCFKIGDDEIWVPKSVVEGIDESTVEVREWFVVDKGLV